MVQEMSYNTISAVLESWEQLRQIENYEHVAGTKLFIKLFDKCPQAKVTFGFQIDTDPHSDDLLQSKRFTMHAAYLIQMIDTALNMLGPDIELLSEMLYELGTQHVGFGVKPEYFPVMGASLIKTIEECLKDKFTEDMKQSWEETYRSLSHDMIRAIVDQRRKS